MGAQVDPAEGRGRESEGDAHEDSVIWPVLARVLGSAAGCLHVDHDGAGSMLAQRCGLSSGDAAADHPAKGSVLPNPSHVPITTKEAEANGGLNRGLNIGVDFHVPSRHLRLLGVPTLTLTSTGNSCSCR